MMRDKDFKFVNYSGLKGHVLVHFLTDSKASICGTMGVETKDDDKVTCEECLRRLGKVHFREFL